MAKPVDPGGSAPQSHLFGKGMAKEAETLAKFKSRIDKVLSDLEKSPASKTKLDEQTISRAAYGNSTLTSADALSQMYNQVHEKIKIYSKTFGDQLEALGIAALIAEKGYDGVDAEQRRRMQEIQAEAQKYYRAPKSGQSGASGDSSHDGRSVGPDAS
ncbi:hypothetical protein [Streptomyces sparsogenes]|uniref:hypothetical protein n=1 Tax=Streptomyces sparsogenes TaxID=67365 RepID=UPI000A9878DA|nr:hypothetical protein [Streptomyces sparsogenes]